MNPSAASPRAPALSPLALMLVPLAFLLWGYWSTLAEMTRIWTVNPSYSHGWLVPIFAGFLLWLRRRQLDPAALRPSAWGLLLLGSGIGMRLLGTFFFFAWLDPLSLVPCCAGVFLLVGGRHALRWAWPACLFLFFMIPLPYSLAEALSGPLQQLATLSSTFLMQVVGLPALSEGNVIKLNEQTLNVEEACSGLRMLMVFFALSTAMAVLIDRPWVDRLILLASAIPIALITNVIRVTATGILFETAGGATAHAFFHDVAGWLMMPIALGLLWVEFKVLTHLFIEPDPRVVRPTRGPTQREAIPSRSSRARPTLPPAPRKRRRPELGTRTP
jgi:exosortase